MAQRAIRSRESGGFGGRIPRRCVCFDCFCFAKRCCGESSSACGPRLETRSRPPTNPSILLGSAGIVNEMPLPVTPRCWQRLVICSETRLVFQGALREAGSLCGLVTAGLRSILQEVSYSRSSSLGSCRYSRVALLRPRFSAGATPIRSRMLLLAPRAPSCGQGSRALSSSTKAATSPTGFGECAFSCRTVGAPSRARVKLDRDELASVGLCARCHHARVVKGRRSLFWFCELSRTDPRFVKYPRLPVLECPGYRPSQQETDPSEPSPENR